MKRRDSTASVPSHVSSLWKAADDCHCFVLGVIFGCIQNVAPRCCVVCFGTDVAVIPAVWVMLMLLNTPQRAEEITLLMWGVS